MRYTCVLSSEKDGHFYIGTNSDLRKRLKQHVQGRVTSTAYRRPLRLMPFQHVRTSAGSWMHHTHMHSVAIASSGKQVGTALDY